MQKLEAVRAEDEERRAERERELRWLRGVLLEQKEEERRRAREMETLFTEEAETAWGRQERLWDEERRARKKLMEDVIQGWKGQIREKMEGRGNKQSFFTILLN